MSVEIELKFQVPAARLDAVRRALETPAARQRPMAARYFDTDGQHLAAARVALRLRREGRQWVQTLKCDAGADADAAGPLARLEHNVPLGTGARADLDLARHAGTAAGERLAQALAAAAGERGQAAALHERYATRVSRLTRVVRHQGATVELALDVGELRSGERREPVCELEFELLSGPPQGLLALAARWVARHGLVLDVRSKSERGSLLAAGRPTAPPVPATRPVLQRAMSLPQALQQMLRSCLAQVLPNASQLAAGGAAPEHLHQLRVGLRRLRSLQRLYGPAWPPLAAMADDGVLARLWQALSTARDQDVLSAGLWPSLQAAGAPPLDTGTTAPADTAALALLLADAEVQQLWLRLLAPAMVAPQALAARQAAAEALPALASAAPPGEAVDRPDGLQGLPGPHGLRGALVRPLKQLLRRVRRDGAQFDTLDTPARHRLRRRIKRLRYGLELVSALLPPRRLRRLLRRLGQAQDALGACNDAAVAEQACRELAAHQPVAWFAVGWLAARRAPLQAAAAEALRPLVRGLHGRRGRVWRSG